MFSRFRPSCWGNRFRKTVFWSLLGYLVFLVLLVPLIRIGGDRYWWATPFLYVPRIVYGAPILVLIPAMLYVGWRRSHFVMLLVSFLLWFGPLMGFTVSWQAFFAGDSPERIRVLTCNIYGDKANRQLLDRLVRLTHVDLVALQEYGQSNKEVVWPEGWNHVHHGELGIGSRWPILRTEVHHRIFPPSKWPGTNAVYCVVDSPSGPIGFAAIHLRTPRQGLMALLDRKTLFAPSRRHTLIHEIDMRRKESAEVLRWLNTFPEPKIIAGDFNMPSDSSIFRRDWSSYTDAFGYAGFGFGLTKQTETPRFGGTFGSRIDFILMDENFRPNSCWVGPNLGSDHRPVLAEINVVEE